MRVYLLRSIVLGEGNSRDSFQHRALSRRSVSSDHDLWDTYVPLYAKCAQLSHQRIKWIPLLFVRPGESHVLRRIRDLPFHSRFGCSSWGKSAHSHMHSIKQAYAQLAEICR